MSYSLETAIVSHHVESGTGTYVLKSTATRPNGIQQSFTTQRRFREFRALHKEVGIALGLDPKFPLHRFSVPKTLLHAPNVDGADDGIMATRSKVLHKYITGFVWECENEYPESLLKFLGVNMLPTTNLKSMKINREAPMKVTGSSPLVKKGDEFSLASLPLMLLLFIVKIIRLPVSTLDSLLGMLEKPLGGGDATGEEIEAEAVVVVGGADTPTSSSSKASGDLCVLSDSGKKLFEYLDPMVRKSGKIPLYIAPPGAVVAWKANSDGKILITLDNNYQRIIVDEDGGKPVSFEVKFGKNISCKLVDGALTELEGVGARRLPLTTKARLVKMALPLPGQKTLAFTVKVAFFSLTIPLSISHFEKLEAWHDTEQIESM